MAKKMKKMMSMVLALCMMVSVMAVPAFAADESVVNDGAEVVTTTIIEENGDTNLVITIEKTEETIEATGTVNVPTEAGKTEQVVIGAEEDKTIVVSGSEESGEYVQETVKEQATIVVETKEVTVTEEVDAESTEMNYVHSTTEATKENDLIEYNPAADAVNPEDIEVSEGYTHVIAHGNGNISRFAAALLWREPASPDEKPVFVDENGVAYYLGTSASTFERRKMYVDNYYVDGEFMDEDYKRMYARYDHVQQFVMVDAATGKMITTYCADQKTPAEGGTSYIMENLEDATYYDDAQAEHIRAIANNGYWGTESGFGSLETMKAQLKESKKFTDEEIAALTDGMAMTATQFAIWSFSNVNNGDAYVNCYNAYMSGSDLAVGRVSEDDKAAVDLIFKVYEHLKSLTPDEVEKTTADTIINENNFIDVDNMDLTVLKKADDHENNKDNDASNDAYVTELTFALVVKPAEGNEDELVVEVLTGGKTYKGRIAGTAQEGEVQLFADEKGNYTFKNIVMVEGDQTFSISLKGIQNLQEGVYLYTSEVVDGTSSQTMVGVASGKRAVNVTMDIDFTLDVNEGVVVKESVKREEVPAGDPGAFALAVHRPLENIPEEEVPLADAPQTGDEAIVFAVLTLLAGMSLMAMHVSEQKRKEEV